MCNESKTTIGSVSDRQKLVKNRLVWGVVVHPGLEMQALHSLHKSFDAASRWAKKLGGSADVMKLVAGRLTTEY